MPSNLFIFFKDIAISIKELKDTFSYLFIRDFKIHLMIHNTCIYFIIVAGVQNSS